MRGSHLEGVQGLWQHAQILPLVAQPHKGVSKPLVLLKRRQTKQASSPSAVFHPIPFRIIFSITPRLLWVGNTVESSTRFCSLSSSKLIASRKISAVRPYGANLSLWPAAAQNYKITR